MRKSKKIKTVKFNFRFFPIFIFVFLIIIFCLYFLTFRYYKDNVLISSNGFLIGDNNKIISLTNSDSKDNLVNTIKVRENEVLYKNNLDKYRNEKKDNVDLNYPLFFNNGNAIYNFNVDYNLIDTFLDSSKSFKDNVISYGKVFDKGMFEQLEDNNYILLSYNNGIFINLYDFEIDFYDEKYFIPVNSFVYFGSNYVSYFERNGNKFEKKIINNINRDAIFRFYYDSNDEEYIYKFGEFISNINNIKEESDEEIDSNNSIISESEQIEVKDKNNFISNFTPDTSIDYVLPSVVSSKLIPNVYSLSGEITISDPSHVIVKKPTYSIYIDNTIFMKKSYKVSSDVFIKGLLSDQEYTIIGQYTYLDSDYTTKIIKTFYVDTISTKDALGLEDLDISFENGDIYSHKIELNKVLLNNDPDSEIFNGIYSGAIRINKINHYFTNDKLAKILKGEEVDGVSSFESLKSNNKYDFEIVFFDRRGNMLPIINNYGSSKTCKEAPTLKIKSQKRTIDSVAFSLDLKNPDKVSLVNYKYKFFDSSGILVRTNEVDGSIISIDGLEQNKLYTLKVFADIDLDDNKGLIEEFELGSIAYSTIPISNLGYYYFNIEEIEMLCDSQSLRFSINNRKTNELLTELLDEVKINIYKKDSDEIFYSKTLTSNEIQKLKDLEFVDIDFEGLDTNQDYVLEVLTVGKQYDNLYDINCVYDYKNFYVPKKPAEVIISNSFTSNKLINFDIKVDDIDGAILTNFVRLELRDSKNNLISSNSVDTNFDFINKEYDNLIENELYTLYVYADEYNESNSNITYESHKLLKTVEFKTNDSVKGDLELVSSLKERRGVNLLDIESDVKWIETAYDKTIPSTLDEEGHMHIYSKNGEASYGYDLSDYEGKYVTASFRIKAVNELSSDYKLYVGNKLMAPTSTAYGIELTDVSKDKWKYVTYSFYVGRRFVSYSDINEFSCSDSTRDIYYGKNEKNFFTFYFSGGTKQLAEYEIKDLQIIQKREYEEIDVSDYKIEQGRLVVGWFAHTWSQSDTSSTYVRLNKPLDLPEDGWYTVSFSDDPNISVYLQGGEKLMNGKDSLVYFEYGMYQWNNITNGRVMTYHSPPGLNNYTFYYKKIDNLYLGLHWSKSINMSPSEINFRIFKNVEINNDIDMEKEYIPYDYSLSTKVKVNLTNSYDDIEDNSYYLNVYNSNDEMIDSLKYDDLKESSIVKDSIKELDIPSGDNYKIDLVVKISGKDYVLDSVNVSTTHEVKGIYTTDDWAFMQPKGNYLIHNDLTFDDYNLQALGFGYRYFYGTIDGQGHTLNLHTSNENYTRIGRVEKEGIIKNLVLNVNLDNPNNTDYIGGFIDENNGLIENVFVNLTDNRAGDIPEDKLYILCNKNMSTGVIRNFIVNVKNEVNLYKNASLISSENYGLIENGYVYGSDFNVTIDLLEDESRNIGLIQKYGGKTSTVRNIYTLNSINFKTNNSNDVAGLISYETYGNINSTYSYGTSNRNIINVGPVACYFGAVAKIKNAYYISDIFYSSDKQKSASIGNLLDVNFQMSLLDEHFNVKELMNLGYFPQLVFSSSNMPPQDYISLPINNSNSNLDIMSQEIVDDSNIDFVLVDLEVLNPTAEIITDINVSNVDVEVLGQTQKDLSTIVSIKVSNPKTFVSKYDIRNIISKNYLGISSVKEYSLGEKILYVDFYNKITNIDEFKNINVNPNQNYILMNDLDFDNEKDFIIHTFNGKFNGNNNSLLNISLNSNFDDGLFSSLNGSIVNLNVDGFFKFGSSSNNGFIGYSSKNAIVSNVHINNLSFDFSNSKDSNGLYAGGLVGVSSGSTIENSSISNISISSNIELSDISIGGLVGNSFGTKINNCFVYDITINVSKSIFTNGVGGIVGYEYGDETGEIVNSYVVGSINNNSVNTGGIAGFSSSNIEKCISFTSLSSTTSYIGGIVGKTSNIDLINNSLFIGDIYNNSSDMYFGQISGNSSDNGENFFIDSNKVNGVMVQNSSLTKDSLFSEDTYLSTINLGSKYDYSDISLHQLPKLKYFDNDDILPFQSDVKFIENDIEIDNIYIEKNSVNETAIAVIDLKNVNNYEIVDLIIDDMDSEIVMNDNNSIKVNLKPLKYYDSYKLSKIKYIKDGKTVSQDIGLKIDVTFYKFIYSVDDWNNVSTVDAENYILANDLSFKNQNINTNLIFNRLITDSESTIHTISDIDISKKITDNNYSLIKNVLSEISNVSFKNILLEDTYNYASNQFNLIIYNNAIMKNVSFDNVELIGRNKNNISLIGESNNNISNVNISNINITGKNDLSGFVSKVNNNYVIADISASDITISGHNNIGGLFSNMIYQNSNDDSNITNITAENISIDATGNYIGGIIANGNVSSSNINHVTLSGNDFIGGIAGVQVLKKSIFNEARDVNITSSGSVVGGLIGKSYSVEDSYVDTFSINASSPLSKNVGGLVGEKNGDVIRCGVLDGQITSGGDIIGGLVGNNVQGNIDNSYAYKANVTADNKAGGLIGSIYRGNVKYIRISESVINSNQNYSGGIVGFVDNYNNGIIVREPTFNEISLEDVSIGGAKYTGGLFGAMNAKINALENNSKIYFSGTIKSTLKTNSGLGSGDIYNEDVISFNKVYFFDESVIEEKVVKDIETTSQNKVLGITMNNGYVDPVTGELGSNSGYPNAQYSNLIDLKKNNFYKFHMDSKQDYNLTNYFKIYFYKNGKFLGDISSSNALKCVSEKSYTGYYLDSSFYSISDCQIRIYQVNKSYVLSQKLESIKNNGNIRQEQLINSNDLTDKITWFNILGYSYFTYEKKINFSEKYWNFDDTTKSLDGYSVKDLSGNNRDGVIEGDVVLSKNGLHFYYDQGYLSTPHKITNNYTYSATIIYEESGGYPIAQKTFLTDDGSENYTGIINSVNYTCFRSGSSRCITNFVFKHGNTYNLTWTLSGSTAKLYVDGVYFGGGSLNVSVSYLGEFVMGLWYSGIIKDAQVWSKVLTDEEIRNAALNPGSVTNKLDIYYDFTNPNCIDYNEDDDLHYPTLKWHNSEENINYQRTVKLPDRNGGISTASLLNEFATSSIMMDEDIDDIYHVYSSGIDSFNLEFDKISKDLKFDIKIGDYVLNDVSVNKRVYTFGYNYIDDINIKIYNSSNSKDINIKANDLIKDINLYNDNYYYINKNILYKNNKNISLDAIHIYDNQVLLKNNKIYDLNSGKVYDLIFSEGLRSRENALYTSVINDSLIKTYYNYSTVSSKDGVVNKEGQLIAKDYNLFLFNGNNINNFNVFNIYDNDKYQFSLSRDGSIISYEKNLNYGLKVLNKNIVEIEFDYNSNKPIVIIKYKDGNIIGWNYHDGKVVFESDMNENISYFKFIFGNMINNNKELSNDKSYKDNTKLAIDIENIDDSKIQSILDSINESNNSVEEVSIPEELNIDTDEVVSSDNINTDSKNRYFVAYNSSLEKYEVYDVENILNNNDNYSIDNYVQNNSFISNYIKNKNKSIFNSRKLLIISVIICIVIINTFILINRIKVNEK